MNLAYSSASRLGVPNCGVPNWGYSSASRIGGSQIEGFQRVPNELFIKVQVSGGGGGMCVCTCGAARPDWDCVYLGGFQCVPNEWGVESCVFQCVPNEWGYGM